MLWLKSKIRGAGVRFLLTGIMTAVVFGALLSFFYDRMKFNQNVAVTLSFAVALLVNFSGNKYFVFRRKESGGTDRQFGAYLILTANNYLITLAITNIIVALSLPILTAAFACPAVTMFISYFSMSRIIFADAVPPPAAGKKKRDSCFTKTILLRSGNCSLRSTNN